MSHQITRMDAPLDVPLGDLLDADQHTRVAALEALCDAIATSDIQDERDQHTGAELGELSVRTHHALTRVRGKQYQWLAVEEADGLWTTSTFQPRTFASYVAHSHGISYGNARRLTRLARQLRDAIPQFGVALRTGAIGSDQVEAFASTALTSPTRVAALGEEVAAAPGGPAHENSEPADYQEAEEALGNSEATETITVEEMLLDQARHLRPDQVRRLGKHFAQVADPEADERGYRQAKEREYAELVRTLDGWHLSGFLTEENGRLLRAAMDAAMSPPAPDDQRTSDQRRAQALADLAHLVLNQGLAGTHASVHPHLGVLIHPGDFQRLLREAAEDAGHQHTERQSAKRQQRARPAGTGSTTRRSTTGRSTTVTVTADPPRPTEDPPRSTESARPPQRGEQHRPRGEPSSTDHDPGRLDELSRIDWATRLTEVPPIFDDGTGPVPPDLLRRMATCGEVYRILFSPDSEVINHGRTHRLFTAAQRRALVARDNGCTWPGCTAPPSLCESHHARIHWADGGPTDVANGALLCFHHHSIVDARSISMTRADGTWIFTRPDGSVLNTDRHSTGAQDAWTLTS